ncbi:MAG TPA: efflux RND transporter periplasmic adaptor subunit [Thermoanaerobaculaceae bacterium]|nr:efflux RND transporter periplasmic adaptor subunit [Thermoanaerobaculaceae bacterium]
MRRASIAVLAVLVLSSLSVGCTAVGEGKDAQSGKPPVAVEVSPATTADLVDGIDVVGSLAPKFAVDVKSEFTAIVREVQVTEWVKVATGQSLAVLDSREGELAVEAAKAALLQAEVGQARAERELERTVKLKEYGLATQQNLDDARTARDAAAAVAASARAAVGAAETRLAKSVIRSPMDGVVAYRGVSVGDRVENMGGGPMFRIVDNRVLDLTVAVPSSRSAALRVGQPLEFTADAVPGRTFRGTVMYINPAINETDRSVKLVAEVPNGDDALRGGVFVKGRVLTGRRPGVLQIPRTALLSWDVERHVGDVFVVTGDVAERRTVRTGQTTADSVEVVEGLASGDRVVTRGGFNLRPGDRVQVVAPQGA